ncbi:NAD-dependent epimerase/dehydratase family protein [Nocardioides acrostichi]|uniref:NAD(P)-dependent oxidoreductase n=1 Tax=Nocardioides acrostichi TaxID=2784339 RepID=A0A930V1N0_9ACTN|nr:NAD(P)-dependent oxidoreductase [Nocardioides acrostichi]MBF4162241.1 NAD(P)-dependent oxidoreductase [Nocardioides acrostichi]
MPLLSDAPVVVTGACGLVGRHVVAELRSRGYPVVATDLGTRANRDHAAALHHDSDLLWRWCDLTVPEQTAGLVKASVPRAVVHLAGVIPPLCYSNPGLAEKVNVGATQVLVDAIAAHAPQARLVHASSIGTYGPRNPHRDLGLLTADTPQQPEEVYGLTKLRAEELVRGASTPWVVLRLGGVMTTDVGAQMSTDNIFFEGALPADGRLQTVDVRDVARAFGAAIGADCVGEILLIGGDETHRRRYADISHALAGAMGLEDGIPPGRPGNPDDDTAWFATDWMDTDRAQEVLDFQRITWPALLEEVRTASGWMFYGYRVAAPVVRIGLARLSPYRGQPGEYADPWRVIAERWPASFTS